MERAGFKGGLPAWTLGDFIEAADPVLAWLRARSPQYSRGNRFELYAASAKKAAAAEGDRWLTPVVHEGLQSLMELYYVSRALDDSVRVPPETIDALLEGAAGKSREAPGTPWNFQFELFSHALLRLSGLSEVTIAEPDLLVPAGDANLCLAVKRMSTDRPSAIHKRFKEALGQIREREEEGLVVLSLRAQTVAPTPASEAAFTSLIDSLRRYVDSGQGKRGLGFLVFGFHFYPEPAVNGHINAQTDVTFSMHLTNVAEDSQAAMRSWLAARGKQLLTSLVREHAQLRSRWWA